MLHDRVIRIDVRDTSDTSISGARLLVAVNGQPLAEAITRGSMTTIQVGDIDADVEVSAFYKKHSDKVILACDANEYVFHFPVRQKMNKIRGKEEEKMPVLIGLFLVVVSLGMVFYFQEPNKLQYRAIIACLSIGLGGLGSVIPGFLNIKMSLGKRLAVSAAGALAIFVLLYFFGPGG